MLICIQSVFVNHDFHWKNALWINDLNNHLSNVAKQYDHKLIPIQGPPDPTYLLVELRTLPSRAIAESLFANLAAIHQNLTIDFFEGHYNWQSGCGFSLSMSYSESESSFLRENNCNHYENRLIMKYLEFLENFNRSYDDDLYLNLSFCAQTVSQPD